MKIKIISDLPATNKFCGRIRFKPEKYLGVAKLAAVAETLNDCESVLKAETNAVTESVVVSYKSGCRREILGIIYSIDIETLLPKVNVPPNYGVEFRKELYGKVFAHFVSKWILPKWLSIPLNIIKAVPYAQKALKSFAAGKIGVDLLDGTAIAVSIARKDYKTAASIMFLLNVSETLEEHIKKRTRGALKDSMAMNFETAWVIRGGAETQIPVKDIHTGDKVVVRAGTAIPIDGAVISGEAEVNQASLTGESAAVFKKKNDSVFAGTTIEEGSLVVEAYSAFNDSMLLRIVDLIENSENLKAGIQNNAEKAADKIVPYSFALALGAFLFTGNIKKALSALLVDYSCAIKLSTPISVISALKEAADNGIVIKGGKFLETFAEANAIVFDKTGTLTSAVPALKAVIPFNGFTREEVLRTAACIEEHFPHSLANAVIQGAKNEGITHEEKHAEVEYIVAHGIATAYDGKRVVIGSRHFVSEDEGVEITIEQSECVSRKSGGDSVLYLAVDGKLRGVLCISDPPRNEAKITIDALRKLGVKRFIMLTGDSENAARDCAASLGITEYKAQMLPAEKHAFICGLKSVYKVAMLGDGINDAPALAAADVSAAMCGASDLAAETADIMLVRNDLYSLVTLRILGEKLLKRNKNQIAAIVGFNSALILAGLCGVISSGTLALLHNASTVVFSCSAATPLLKN